MSDVIPVVVSVWETVLFEPNMKVIESVAQTPQEPGSSGDSEADVLDDQLGHEPEGEDCPQKHQVAGPGENQPVVAVVKVNSNHQTAHYQAHECDHKNQILFLHFFLLASLVYPGNEGV